MELSLIVFTLLTDSYIKINTKTKKMSEHPQTIQTKNMSSYLFCNSYFNDFIFLVIKQVYWLKSFF